MERLRLRGGVRRHRAAAGEFSERRIGWICEQPGIGGEAARGAGQWHEPARDTRDASRAKRQLMVQNQPRIARTSAEQETDVELRAQKARRYPGKKKRKFKDFRKIAGRASVRGGRARGAPSRKRAGGKPFDYRRFCANRQKGAETLEEEERCPQRRRNAGSSNKERDGDEVMKGEYVNLQGPRK